MKVYFINSYAHSHLLILHFFSTVSKVLRQKDIYLSPENHSPVKKVKDKFPNIKTALLNWARNSKKDRTPLTDTVIKEKAQSFATAVYNNDYLEINSMSWLEKFKQKNGIRAGKLNRRALETNASDNGSLDPKPGDLKSQNSPSPSKPKLESSSGFWKPSDQSQLLT
jgi:Tc5 transposase DNA-binding domain